MSNDGLGSSSIVTERNQNDVILGKGFKCREYSGTKHFRNVIRQHVKDYDSATSIREKNVIAKRVMRSISDLEPTGRFLRELSKEEDAEWHGQTKQGAWVVLDEVAVLKKIKQALRDARRAQGNAAAAAKGPQISHSMSFAADPRPLQLLLPKLPFLQQQYEAGLLPNAGILEGTPWRVTSPLKESAAPPLGELRTSLVRTDGEGRSVESQLPSSPISPDTASAEKEETARQLLALVTSTERRNKPKTDDISVKSSLAEEEKAVGETTQTRKRFKRSDHGPTETV